MSVPATPLAIRLPISVEPVKATLSMPGWVTIDIPISPGPVTMLTTPGGRSASWQTSANRRADSGVVDAGFRTTVLPGGQGRGDLPRQHQQREVPRDDLGRHAERTRDAPRERVLELVRPARVVPEMRRGERDVDVPALLDRLAGIHRFEDGELARPLLQDPRDPEQVLGPFLAGQATPRPRLRAPCRADRAIDVGGRGLRDDRELLLRGRIDRGEGPAVGRRSEPAVDEQPVALLERDQVAGLGCRRVLPGDCLPVTEAPAGRRSIG